MKLTDQELAQLRRAERAHYEAATGGKLHGITGAWLQPGEAPPAPAPAPAPEPKLHDHLTDYFKSQDAARIRRVSR